ncbi:diaminopropionate ammonia-lyase [Parapusillimonas sp. SGNA-6]|nr:diaminopropionate ammonia-lyase [Parapusillimonas sp. SGNA-6]
MFVNPGVAAQHVPYPEQLKKTLSLQGFEKAKGAIANWPGYEPTPLRRLDGLAARLDVKGVYYKDESSRFGLGSFKALGGAYAVGRLLVRELSRQTGRTHLDVDDLRRPEFQQALKDMTVTCATDGNHGRSVAWGARQYGCRCVIYIHENVSAGREQAIASYGARVVRVPGNYDDAVRKAAQDAQEHGYFVVSDTSYPGYMDVPKDVMQGYSVMVQEAIDQIGDGQAPTHVFIQGGVGGLAAAVCAHLWEACGPARPRLIVVEPDKAACLFESARAGKPVAVQGELDTVMAGLACGEVSLLAWDILASGAFAFMTIPDEAALAAMRELAAAEVGDTPIVAGESAVAGVAGCAIAAGNETWRQRLHLDQDSQVLFFASEGDTDPELYQRIVGKTADEVRAMETT